MRDAATGKVRLLIAARVGRPSRPLNVGFVLLGPGGKVAASRGYKGIGGGDGEWAEFTSEAVVDPAPTSCGSRRWTPRAAGGASSTR